MINLANIQSANISMTTIEGKFKLVLDQNVIASYLNVYGNIAIVIPDRCFLENIKSENESGIIKSLERSFGNYRKTPENIFSAKCISEMLHEELKNKEPRLDQIIDAEETLRFRNLLINGFNKISTARCFDAMKTTITPFKQKGRYKEALSKLLDSLTCIKSVSCRGSGFCQKINELTENFVANFIAEYFSLPKSLASPTGSKLITPKSLLYNSMKNLLVYVFQVREKHGSFKISDKLLVNSIIDSEYILTGIFADDFISNDKQAVERYNIIKDSNLLISRK